MKQITIYADADDLASNLAPAYKIRCARFQMEVSPANYVLAIYTSDVLTKPDVQLGVPTTCVVLITDELELH